MLSCVHTANTSLPPSIHSIPTVLYTTRYPYLLPRSFESFPFPTFLSRKQAFSGRSKSSRTSRSSSSLIRFPREDTVQRFEHDNGVAHHFVWAGFLHSRGRTRNRWLSHDRVPQALKHQVFVVDFICPDTHFPFSSVLYHWTGLECTSTWPGRVSTGPVVCRGSPGTRYSTPL